MTDTVRYDDRTPRLFFLAAVVWAVSLSHVLEETTGPVGERVVAAEYDRDS